MGARSQQHIADISSLIHRVNKTSRSTEVCCPPDDLNGPGFLPLKVVPRSLSVFWLDIVESCSSLCCLRDPHCQYRRRECSLRLFDGPSSSHPRDVSLTNGPNGLSIGRLLLVLSRCISPIDGLQNFPAGDKISTASPTKVEREGR